MKKLKENEKTNIDWCGMSRRSEKYFFKVLIFFGFKYSLLLLEISVF